MDNGIHGRHRTKRHGGLRGSLRRLEYGSFLGPLATVGDSERGAAAGRETTNRLFLLTDLQTALQSAINLSNGYPRRSGIERRLKQALHKRRDQDTAIA